MRVIRYGKQILPLISLNATLGYTVKTTGDTISVVVIEKAGALYGLEVDEIVDTLFSEVELDSSLVRKRGLFGNLNAPEGLIVVVDPFDLIDVSLGVSTPASGVIPPTTASVQAPKKLRILFAEDTVFFRKAVHMILGKEGHEVTLANDGEEALQKLRAAPSQFDLIVSDIEMPRLNGFDFARAVRSLPETRRMPMLALSSRADARYAEMGREAGFDRYLEKLKPAALLQAISELTTTADRRAA
jgi:two-component system chemotaxis sensor kinase CheA